MSYYSVFIDIYNFTDMALTFPSVTEAVQDEWHNDKKPSRILPGMSVNPVSSREVEVEVCDENKSSRFDIDFRLTEPGTAREYDLHCYYEMKNVFRKEQNHFHFDKLTGKTKDGSTKRIGIYQSGGQLGGGKKPTLGLYVFDHCSYSEGTMHKTDFTGNDLFRLVVTADLHYNGDSAHDSVLDQLIADARTHCKDHKALFAIGDLVHETKGRCLTPYKNAWKVEGTPMLFDGYGNHDMMYSTGYTTDVGAELKARNKQRKTLVNPDDLVLDTVYSDSLHYRYVIRKRDKSFHCIMLNQLPKFGFVDKNYQAKGDENGRDVDRKRNGNRSMEFLCQQLLLIGVGDPILIFVHNSFWYCDDGANACFITRPDLEAFVSVLRNHNILGIFSGHLHSDRESSVKLNLNTKAVKEIPVFCGGIAQRGKLLDVAVREQGGKPGLFVRVKTPREINGNGGKGDAGLDNAPDSY